MNPYTYRRRAKRAPEPVSAKVGVRSALSLAGEIINAPVSTAIAMAMVVFAAGSVMSIAGVSQTELAAADYVEMPVHAVAYNRAAEQAVLGESIIAVSAARQLGSSVTVLTVTPAEFDEENGMWNYEVFYSLPEGVEISSGSMSIGSKVVADLTASSNTVESGFMLEPETPYELVVWSQPGRSGKRLASTVFITEPSPVEVE